MPNEDINAMLLEKFGFEIAVWPIGQFKARRNNPKRHRHKDLSALHETFSRTGFKDFVKYDPLNDEILDGNGRVAQAISDGMTELPVLIVRDLTNEKMKLLALAYNRAPELSSYDEKMLIENLAELRNLDVDFSYLGYDKYKNDIDMAIGSKLDMVEEVQRVAATQAVQYAESQALGSEDPFTMPQNTALPKPKMPGTALPLAPMQSSALKKETGMGLADTIFPGEPEFGIPMLSLDYEAKEVPAKFGKWAELSAKDKEIMGWHFYTNDYKLTNIWYNPDLLLAGNASIFAEVNFSIRNAHGRAYALGEIERKRKIARWLQSKGRYVLVDLNVGRKHLQDNFLGVPLGWKSYITRGSVEKLPYILDQFDAAIKHAQGDEIFGVIYGGGVDVEDFAKEAGAVYVPERMTAVRENGSDGMAPKVAPSEYKKQKAVS
jgi:hypothetical protein